MIDERWVKAMTSVLVLGVMAWGTGCASSSGQKSGSQTEATQEESSGSAADAGEMAVTERVDFEKLLGTATGGERPPGCSGGWQKLNKSPFPGEAYFCTKFNGPEQWGEIPATVTIEEGKLSVISVQVFYDDSADAKEEYESLTGSLLERCDRKTGFDRNMVLDCGEHFVDVTWQSRHQSSEVKVIYALSFDALPK